MNKLYKFMLFVVAVALGGCVSSPAVACNTTGQIFTDLFAAIAATTACDNELRTQRDALDQAVAIPYREMQRLANVELLTRMAVQARITAANLPPVFSATIQKLSEQQGNVMTAIGIRGLLNDGPSLPIVRDGPHLLAGLEEALQGRTDPARNAQYNATQVCMSAATATSVTLTIVRQTDIANNPNRYAPDVLVETVQTTLAQQAGILSALNEFVAQEATFRATIERQLLDFVRFFSTGVVNNRYNGELRLDPQFVCLPGTTIASAALTLAEQAERIIGSLIP